MAKMLRAQAGVRSLKTNGDGAMSWSVIWWGIGIALVIVALLAARELFMLLRRALLWFWRVDDRVVLLEQIRDELRTINARGVETDASPRGRLRAVEKDGRVEPQ